MPDNVAVEILTFLGAATDWLGGLNEKLGIWDSQFYMGEFRSMHVKERMTEARVARLLIRFPGCSVRPLQGYSPRSRVLRPVP